jgi:hypothetical protein
VPFAFFTSGKVSAAWKEADLDEIPVVAESGARSHFPLHQCQEVRDASRSSMCPIRGALAGGWTPRSPPCFLELLNFFPPDDPSNPWDLAGRKAPFGHENADPLISNPQYLSNFCERE